MRGKIVGLRKFVGKKEGSGEWVNVWLAVPMPEGGVGIDVEKFLCRPSVLPDSPEKLANKEILVSTRNNFISEIVVLDK